MKNKSLFAVVAALLLVGGAFFVFGRGKGSEFAPKSKKDEDVVEEAQKTFKEQQSGEDGKISYKKSIAKGEEVTVEFMMHDYANVPDEVESFQEMKESLTPTKGEASFKVKEIGTVKEIDQFNKAGSGEAFHYIIYDFKGSASNPDSNTIHPASLDETGWDPAPQFVTVIDGDDDYPGSYWEDDLLESKGYERPRGDDFNTTEWVTKAAVWKVKDNDKPVYALKYVSPDDSTYYLKVQ